MTNEEKKYIDLEEGVNKVWLTGLRYYSPVENSDRPKIKLTFSEKPTSETYESPFTSVTLNCPVANDNIVTKMNLTKNIKDCLYPIAEFTTEELVDADGKNIVISAQALLDRLIENTTQFDYEVQALVRLTQGKQVNKVTGEPTVFTNLLAITPTAKAEKGVYESSINWDLVPF